MCYRGGVPDTELTATQRQVYGLFEERSQSGKPPPTLREVSKKFGWKSSAAARDVVKVLVRKGYILPAKGRARGNALASPPVHQVEVPLLARSALMGEEVDLSKHDGRLGVPTYLSAPDVAFAFNATGSEGPRFCDGDMVLASRPKTAREGELLVGWDGVRVLIGRAVFVDAEWKLASCNPAVPPFSLARFAIHGIVRFLIHPFHELTDGKTLNLKLKEL